MGRDGQGRTDAVEQALCDFGAHEAFGRAQKRFERHYGIRVGDSAPREVCLRVGQHALDYLEEHLDTLLEHYDEPVARRRPAQELMAQADGCLLRTGRLMSAQQAVTYAQEHDLPEQEKARLQRRLERGEDQSRPQRWREVHSGLVRRQGQVVPSVLARRCSRNEFVYDVFRLSCAHGLGFATQVLALGDGGPGLKEGFEEHFAQVHYLLDWRHLEVEHFQETAHALGMEGAVARRWARVRMEQCARGEASKVVAELEQLCGHLEPEEPDAPAPAGLERLKKLVGFVTKFVNCVDYDKWKAKGYPIGSSEVESLHKRLVQKRMKVTGACWREENLGPMLALQTLQYNDGWWEEFWEWEYERRATERKKDAAA